MVGIHALSIVQIRCEGREQTERAPCSSLNGIAAPLIAADHCPAAAFMRTKICYDVSCLWRVCLRALDARTGGRYPVGAHDRPLRWRLYMSDESPRQGFFAAGHSQILHDAGGLREQILPAALAFSAPDDARETKPVRTPFWRPPVCSAVAVAIPGCRGLGADVEAPRRAVPAWHARMSSAELAASINRRPSRTRCRG